MSDPYICPLNKRACSCDPAAASPKLHPCVNARRIGKLVRMLASDLEGESVGAAYGLKRLIPAIGLTFNDVATVIENCNGEIEQYKYGDTDITRTYQTGIKKGRELARENSDDFWAGGTPQWDK